MNNIIVLYFSVINKIELIIENLNNLGVNVSEFELELKKIKEDTNETSANMGVIGYNHSNVINSLYNDGIVRANSMLDELEKYQKYYQAINKCDYVKGSQKMVDFNEEVLNDTVSDLIELLKVIKEFDGIADNKESSINALYSVLYEVIKMEYLYFGESKLFDYCKQFEADSINLSRIIYDDIKDLRNSKYDTSKIDFLVSKLNSTDTSNMYLDNDLVRLIVIAKSKEDYTMNLSNALSKLSKEVKSEEKEISFLSMEKKETVNKKANAEKERVIIKKSLLKSSIKVFVTLGALTAVLFSASRGIKGIEYETDAQTYSALTGKTIETEEFTERLTTENYGEVEDLVTIEKNNPWVRTIDDSGELLFTRVVEKTKITDVDYDNLSEYLDVNFDDTNSKFEFFEDVEVKRILSSEDSYGEPYYEVVKQHQNTENSRIGVLDFEGKVNLGFAYFVILLVYGLGMLMSFAIFDSGLICRIASLRRDVKKIIRNNKDIKESMRELNLIVNQINLIIAGNEELRKKYFELVEKPEYKYIFDECNIRPLLIKDNIDFNEEQIKLLLKN